MKRISFIGSALVSVYICVAISAGAASAQRAHASDAGRPPRAVLQNLVCQRALDPPERAINVEAVMRPLTGTRKLQMEFLLLQKAAGATSFSPVSGSGLGVWLSPNVAGLGQNPKDRWIVPHPVADLPAPAVYRYVVNFRWIGNDGRVIGNAQRISKACYEPELRPDLEVQGITVNPVASHPKLDQYAVEIDNAGVTGTGPFTVQLAFPANSSGVAGVVKDQTVQHIGAHGTRTVQFTGPACALAGAPTVTVDPADQVDVYSRADTVMVATCPASTTTTTTTTTTPTTTTATGGKHRST
jgi:hypothetical protein